MTRKDRGLLRHRLFELRLVSELATRRAFDRVAARERVASCSVELAARRVRFLAPEGLARELVEQIYLDGGLVWSQGHSVQLARSAPPAERPTGG